MISREAWQRVDAALDEILALPNSEWPEACVRLAGNDEHLRQELESLLARVGGVDPILDHPAGTAAAIRDPFVHGLEPNTVIGAYRIVNLLGRGGMGEVYRATRADGHFDHQVAIKLIRREFADRPHRFHAERQILARLEHPNIAHLLDGGMSNDGRPYMVMELVSGVAITTWCELQRSTLTERLELFMKVCDAVAHAHRNLVVHGDLKPANVLVTAEGEVKLLDFGVARLLDEVPNDETRHSALTPGNAAPEQFTGAPVTTATDVYSLGMLLFELLAGGPAWGGAAGASLATLVGRALNEDVPTLSVFVSSQPVAPLSAKLLTGDLDAIVAKAVRKEPERRYESVSLLQADVLRTLRSEPVSARAGARWYIAGRFVRRHRWPLAAATVVATLLLLGVATTLWQAREAIAQARRAEAIQAFLLSLFRSNTPSVAGGHEATAKDLLAKGSARADADLKDQPRALATLHSELGDIYNEMGDDKTAIEHLDRALAGFAALGQTDSREALEALFRRGTVLLDLSQWDRARADLNLCLERGRKVYGPRHRWAVGAREKLAFILDETGQSQAAIDLANEALAQPPGEDAANDALRRLRVRVIIGEAQTDLGEFAAARATLTRVVADSAGPAGYGVVDPIVYRVLLTRAIYYSGDAIAAEPEAAALVADEERVLGTSHPLVFPARQLWAHSLAGVGRYRDAVAVAQQTLTLAEARPAPTPDMLAVQRQILAAQLLHAARYDEAIVLSRQSLEFFDAQGVDYQRSGIIARRVLGLALLGANRIEESRQVLAALLDLQNRRTDQVAPTDLADVLMASANFASYTGNLSTALTPLTQACALLERSPGAASVPARRCRAELAWLRAMVAPADRVKTAAFETAAGDYASVLPEAHLGRADLVLLGAQLDVAAGRTARPGLSAAREQWQNILGRAPAERLIELH